MNDDDDDDDLQKFFLASVHTHLYKQIQSSRCQRLLLSLPKYTRNSLKKIEVDEKYILWYRLQGIR